MGTTSSTLTDEHTNSIRSTTTEELRRREEEEEEKKEKEEERSSETKNVNKVDAIYFYIKDNAKLHHTSKFDLTHDKTNAKSVLRRGEKFYMTVLLKDRDFDVKRDRIRLIFKFGPKPSVNKGTKVVMEVTQDKFTRGKDDWDARIDRGTREKDLMLQVKIPAGAPVGIWKTQVRTGNMDRSLGKKMVLFRDKNDIFILFNPWCIDDPVYMEDEAKLEEYVMNDEGKVYVGSYRNPRGRPWAFGQFDDIVLPVACYILELYQFPYSQRGNPVQVVRAISAGVNDVNDEGILTERSDGIYTDGVAPYKWSGSVRILEEYVKNAYKPVKYGQCWVFSALTTTICRALGIPCRSVTNFVSAHDTNASLTVDKFFDKHHDEIKGGPDGNTYDEIWDFHAWNDVWMTRTDLPEGYGGWQAIDATPQQESDHKMQCGPASLKAIRRGDIGLGYDCAFVFTEVNADIMHWGEDDDSEWGFRRLKMDKYHIGRSILTHKVGAVDDSGGNDAENIVDEYKNREGTPAERASIHNAVRGSRRAQLYYEYKSDIKNDVEFDLVEIDRLAIGEPFRIKVTFRNTSNENRTVLGTLTANSVYYTGLHHSLIKKAEGTIKLKPKEIREIALTIHYDEYWKKLQEYCMIKMFAICKVAETKQTWTDEDDFQVEKPSLNIKVPEIIIRGEPCEVAFSFKNPLNDELTECELSIDGSGLLRPTKLKLPRNVAPKGDFSYRFRFYPRIHGRRKLIASFNSKELFDINGNKTMIVKKPR